MTYSTVNIHHKPFFGSTRASTSQKTISTSIPIESFTTRDGRISSDRLEFETLTPKGLRKIIKENNRNIATLEAKLASYKANLDLLSETKLPILKQWGHAASLKYVDASNITTLRNRLGTYYKKNITEDTQELTTLQEMNGENEKLLKQLEAEKIAKTETPSPVLKKESPLDFPFQASKEEQHKWFQSHLAKKGERLDRESLEIIYKGMDPPKSSTPLSEKTDPELLAHIREIIDLDFKPKEKPAISSHSSRSKSPSQFIVASENPFTASQGLQRQASPISVPRNLPKKGYTDNDLVEIGKERARDCVVKRTEEEVQDLLKIIIEPSLLVLAKKNQSVESLAEDNKLEFPASLPHSERQDYMKGVLTAQRIELKRMLADSQKSPPLPTLKQVILWEQTGESRATSFLQENKGILQTLKIRQRIKKLETDLAQVQDAKTTEQLLRLMVNPGKDWLYHLSAPGNSFDTEQKMLLKVLETEKTLLNKVLHPVSLETTISKIQTPAISQPSSNKPIKPFARPYRGLNSY